MQHDQLEQWYAVFWSVLKRQDKALASQLRHGLPMFNYQYLFPWAITAGAHVLSTDCVARVWDRFFVGGAVELLKAFVGVVMVMRTYLMECSTDGMQRVLQSFPRRLTEHEVMAQVDLVRVTATDKQALRQFELCQECV